MAVLFLFSAAAAAADGTYGSGSIFGAGSSSRAVSMGGAFTALADDSSAVYWNPAGLIKMERQQLSLLYYPLYVGALYNSITYGQPILDLGAIGVGVYRVFTDGIETYDASDTRGSDMKFEQYKATLSYAKRLSDEFTAGFNVNVMNVSFLDKSATGFGADAGILYEPFSFLSMGFTIHNLIKPSLGMRDGKEEIPQDYNLGLVIKLPFDPVKANLAFDASREELSDTTKLRAGAEITIWKALSLRGGYNDGGIVFGGGIKLLGVAFDYAYIANDYLGSLSRFTMSYDFGLSLNEQKVEREKALKEQVKQLVEKEFRQKELDKAKVYFDSAFAMYKAGKLEEALDEDEKALAWSKDYAEAKSLKALINKKLIVYYYDNALVSYKRGDLVSALEGFKNVFAADPSYRDAKDYVDRINQKMEMRGNAKEYFTKGVELYVNRQYDEALDMLKKALSAEPGNSVIKTYISKANAQLKKSSGAKDLTDEQAERVKKLYYAGLKMYTSGDLKAAVGSWKEAININPDDIKILKSIEKAQAEMAELQKRGIK